MTMLIVTGDTTARNAILLASGCTCVSGMHSRKCVTLQKLRTELTIYIFLLWSIFLDNFSEELWTTINPKPLELLTLFQRWELGLSISYQVTSGDRKLALNMLTNCPYTSLDFFFFLTTTFGYAQPRWAIVNHSQSGYGPNAIKY